MITALRGMKDIIDEAAKFEHILQCATRVARRYGFSLIETPILEETALFKRSVGESSDIVGKEMYQFTDKGGNDITLRPEGTAGVVRAFIEKKLDKAGGVQRYFYHGPMFRYERPQKGRLRQFHQFGIECFGEASVYEDASVILMAADIFAALKIGYELEINSLGCDDCLPGYRAALVRFLSDHENAICEDCRRRKESNPIRVLDCKNEACQHIYEAAPLMADHLCGACEADFGQLRVLLDKSAIAYRHNKKLVRGLDYYNKTAFEFVSDAIGAQSAIAGGGRYDRLVGFLGGKPTPAVGFALGLERIYDLITPPEPERAGWYLGAMEPEALSPLFQVAHSLRQSGTAYYTPEAKKLKAHLKAADKLGVRYCAVMGEEELDSGCVWVKDLVQKSESKVPLGEVGGA
jgi:histidyl-tRNA synthetase